MGRLGKLGRLGVLPTNAPKCPYSSFSPFSFFSSPISQTYYIWHMGACEIAILVFSIFAIVGIGFIIYGIKKGDIHLGDL